MMKLRKLLTSLFLICFCVICSLGCASVEMMRTVDASYKITDKFVITLDKKKLGADYQTIKDSIAEDMVDFRNYVYQWIHTFEEPHPEIFNELTKGIVCQEVVGESNQLSLSIEFNDTYCFGLFYGLVSLDGVKYNEAMEDIGPFVSQMLKQEYNTEGMGLFLYKYSMVNCSNILDFVDNYAVDGIGTNYYDKYNDMVYGYSIDDIDLTQVFVYPDSRLYSNADVRQIVEGYTFLAWELNGKPEGFEMSVYRIAPEVIAWYVLALIVSVVAIIVIFVYLKMKGKKDIYVKITKREVEKDER